MKSLAKQWRITIFTLLGIGVFLALVAFAADRAHIPFAVLSSDPTATTHTPIYTGIISNLGVLIWCIAMTVCFSNAAIVLRISQQRTAFWFLVSSGCLTAILLADDLLTLHENIFSKLLGVDEKIVYAMYVVLLIPYLGRFARSILQTDYLLFLTALGLFGCSIIVDVAFGGWLSDDFIIFIEDSSKLAGILGWCVYWIRTSFDMINSYLKPSRLI